MLSHTVWNITDEKVSHFLLLFFFKSPGVKGTVGTSRLGNWAALLAGSNAEPVSKELCFFFGLPTEKLPVGLCLFVFLFSGGFSYS